MLAIRLQRTGKRNSPDFRIVVAPKTAAAQKHFLEVLGSFNPRTKKFVVKDEVRVKYWISQNVRVSPTVYNLFVSNGLVTGSKVKAFSLPPKKQDQPEEDKSDVKSEKVEEQKEQQPEEIASSEQAEAPTAQE